MEYIYSHKSKQYILYNFMMISHQVSFYFNRFYSGNSDIK